MAETDFTAMERDRLLAEHDDGQDDDVERQIAEARRRYPAARVFWDSELGDVVVDVSTGARR